MGADGEKPIVLRETCEHCSKPLFPSRPGTAASLLHRPGFCNCAVKTVKPSPNNPGLPVVGADLDPGIALKIPDNQKIADNPMATAANASVRRFDPNVQLADVVASGFRFFDRVGKGTLGYVYQAEADHIDALLAIKIFHLEPFANKRTLKRLEQEATVAVGVSHPHLASVYKFGVSEKGYPFIVMDFMAGPSLAEILNQEGYLDGPRALDLFIQIAEALEYAHSEKLLHRGLKPSNIYLLTATNGSDFVKVADFGIAKILPNPGRETKYMTPQGEEFGNPSYMSPEQCLGGRLDARSDIYSFGCIMYECMCGKKPHTSSNPVRIAFKQVSEEARSMVERFVDLDIPKEIDNIVLTCLQKDPEQRFENVKQLRLALEAVRDGKKAKLPRGGATGANKKATGASNALPPAKKEGSIIDSVLKIFKREK